MALGRMAAIRLEIEEIVQHVGAGCGQAESRERERASRHDFRLHQPMVQQDRHEDEQVLHPLVRAQGPHEGDRTAWPARRPQSRGIASSRNRATASASGVDRPSAARRAAPVSTPEPRAVPVDTMEGKVR